MFFSISLPDLIIILFISIDSDDNYFFFVFIFVFIDTITITITIFLFFIAQYGFSDFFAACSFLTKLSQDSHLLMPPFRTLLFSACTLDDNGSSGNRRLSQLSFEVLRRTKGGSALGK